MHFLTDDIYRLGGNQRAKLQYHILAQRFPLVELSDQDKRELEAFVASSESETAQRWHNRMKWPQGHEKLVTFGASLEVENKQAKGRVCGLWCYAANLEETQATYSGIRMDWDIWAAPMIDYLNAWRSAVFLNTKEAMQGAMLRLYY